MNTFVENFYKLGRILAEWTVRFRYIVIVSILAVTCVFAYYTFQLEFSTKFVNLFPQDHPFVKLYERYKDFGGAQTVIVMIRNEDGTIFKHDHLKTLRMLHEEVNSLPDINHNEVFSLTGRRTTYVQNVGGALKTVPYMYPDIPKTEQAIESVREKIMKSALVGDLVSADGQSAVVRGSFHEKPLEYAKIYNRLQELRRKVEKQGLDFAAMGQPVIYGIAYAYFPYIAALFVISLILILGTHHIVLFSNKLWWVPALTAVFSAFWGLGFASMMGWTLDPLLIVIPFLLAARDLAHGVQWMDRYREEYEVHEDKLVSAERTLRLMGPPAFLSIVTDAIGVFFLFISGIPILVHMAFMGAFWLASAMITVVVFNAAVVPMLTQPVKPEEKQSRLSKTLLSYLADSVDKISNKVIPGNFARTTLLISLAILIGGFVTMEYIEVGYGNVGTPLYREDTQVNQDIEKISKYFPTNLMTVIVSHRKPAGQVLRSGILKEVSDFEQYMRSQDQVASVVSFADILASFNSVFHYQHPRFYNIPFYPRLAADLTQMYIAGSAPGEFTRWIDNDKRHMVIRMMLQDQTNTTLSRTLEDIQLYFQQRPDLTLVKGLYEGGKTGVRDTGTDTATAAASESDQNLPTTKTGEVVKSKSIFKYVAGPAGLLAAANQSVRYVHNTNLLIVLFTIFVFCALIYSSFVGGLVLLGFTMVANFSIFLFMAPMGMNLTVNTLPVVSISIGMGINFGIYLISRIQDEYAAGHDLREAASVAVATTGKNEFYVMLIMLASVVSWIFSPVLFHFEMGLLLALLMIANTYAALLLIPALAIYFEPDFIVESREQVSDQEGEPL